MAWHTTGNYETEFDKTTNMVLQTIQRVGVTDEQIGEDQQFLVDLFMTIGRANEGEDDREWMGAMDCAFIGLIYHRHILFKDEDNPGVLIPRPDWEATDYLGTMNMVIQCLIIQLHVPQHLIESAIQEGADRAMKHCRKPESFDSEGLTLHKHLVCLMIIGVLVHRLLPRTSTPPNQQ